MRCFVGFMIALLFSTASSVLAQESLSDLDLESFQEMTRKSEVRLSSNPFASGTTTAGDLTVEDLILMGTALGEGNSYALINGYLMRPGDRIAGYRVDSIESGRVVLKRLEQVYILPMGSGF